MEGTQIVDAEVIPPDNDDNGEDQRILANIEAPLVSLEEVQLREETLTSVRTDFEYNLLELTTAREDEYEPENNSHKDGLKKRIRGKRRKIMSET